MKEQQEFEEKVRRRMEEASACVPSLSESEDAVIQQILDRFFAPYGKTMRQHRGHARKTWRRGG